MDFITEKSLTSRQRVGRRMASNLVGRSSISWLNEKKLFARDKKTLLAERDRTALGRSVGLSQIFEDGDMNMMMTTSYEDAEIRLCANDKGLFYREHSYAIPPHLRGQKGSCPTLLAMGASDCSSKCTDLNDGDYLDGESLYSHLLQPAGDHLSSAGLGGSSITSLESVRRAAGYDVLMDSRHVGLLPLNEEEVKMCEKEGVRLPLELPLTKTEERVVKRIRRKIRNKRSAQESRRRKQAYVEALEMNLKASSEEIVKLQRRLHHALTRNKHLEMEINRYRDNDARGNALDVSTTRGSSGTRYCVTVFLISVAIAALTVFHNIPARNLFALDAPGEDVILPDEPYLNHALSVDSMGNSQLPLLYEHDVITGLYDSAVDADHQVFILGGDSKGSDSEMMDTDFQYLLNAPLDQSSNLLLDEDIGFGVEMSSISRLEPFELAERSQVGLLDGYKLEPLDDDLTTPWCASLSSSMFVD